MKERRFFVNPFRIISPKLNADVVRVDEAHPVKATEVTCLEEGLLIMLDKLIEMTILMRRSLIETDREKMGKSAELAVPTLDHYLPMIHVIALQGQNEPLKFVHEGFQLQLISMRCFQIG